MSDPRLLRVGDEDRRLALELLAAHHAAGRLDSFEYEDRRGRAGDADTRGDLDALFTDLPPLDDQGRPLPDVPQPPRRSRAPWVVPVVILGLVMVTRSGWWIVIVPAMVWLLRRRDRRRR